jgi:hypothetical protein
VCDDSKVLKRKPLSCYRAMRRSAVTYLADCSCFGAQDHAGQIAYSSSAIREVFKEEVDNRCLVDSLSIIKDSLHYERG